MSDDLRPKSNLLAIIGCLAGVAGIAWGIARWAATTPTREEFNASRDEIVRVRLELPVMNARIERVDQSQQRVEKAIERIENKQDEASRKRR
jgi:hypothetical protein